MRSLLLKQTLTPIFRKVTPSRRLHSSAVSRATVHAPRISFHNSPLLQLLFKHPKRTSVRHVLGKRCNSTKPSSNPTPNLNSPEPSLSLSQRFRKLSREYGWSAAGIYLALSALDFPFCFLAVRWLGTDRIGRWEHAVLEWVWKVWEIVPNPFQDRGAQAVEGVAEKARGYGVVQSQSDEVGIAGYDHGVKEAEARNRSENASRHLDAAGPRLCDSQKLHFHPDTYRGSGHAEGGQDPARMGLGYWQTTAEGNQGNQGALSDVDADPRVHVTARASIH
ncbi:hypothetical protein MMC07_005541 [Pseudocyphellaria aurata]|nr:hypothetical protein [Pseudocyphellaria aurata]